MVVHYSDNTRGQIGHPNQRGRSPIYKPRITPCYNMIEKENIENYDDDTMQMMIFEIPVSFWNPKKRSKGVHIPRNPTDR